MFNLTESFPEEFVLSSMQIFYRNADRDERIAYDRQVLNVFRILRSVALTILITYLLGLVWYRLSDNWQHLLYSLEDKDQNATWVINYKLV
jgi:hypothetical protein